MNNLEIDRRLALAIGYEEKNMRVVCGDLFVRRVTRGDSHTPISYSTWERFDHQECRTIYPIAEKYKIFPQWNAYCELWQYERGRRFGFGLASKESENYFLAANPNPRTCIALAVIEASERNLI